MEVGFHRQHEVRGMRIFLDRCGHIFHDNGNMKNRIGIYYTETDEFEDLHQQPTNLDADIVEGFDKSPDST